MVYCCVPKCGSSTKNRLVRHVAFHEFPSDLGLRAQWLLAVARKNFSVNDNSPSSVVCSLHFKVDDYVQNRSIRKLKPGAVPSVFEDFKKKFPKAAKGTVTGSEAPSSSSQAASSSSSSSSSAAAPRTQVHFEESQYEQHRLDGRKKLKPNAVPTLFHWSAENSLLQQSILPPLSIKTEPLDDAPSDPSPVDNSRRRVDYTSLRSALLKRLLEKRKQSSDTTSNITQVDSSSTETAFRPACQGLPEPTDNWTYLDNLKTESSEEGEQSSDITPDFIQAESSSSETSFRSACQSLPEPANCLTHLDNFQAEHREKMAPRTDDKELLKKIQETYVPFLKKLIAFLEKNKKATPDSLNKLKAIYTIFTTAPSQEQIETFYANQKKLENWYKKSQKEKNEDGDTPKGNKRSLALSDTESSQGACDNSQPAAKKACTPSESADSDSSQPSILMVQSVNQSSIKSFPVDVSQIKKEKVDVPKVVVQKPVVQVQAPVSAPNPPDPEPAPSGDEPIIFTCASCQFQTREETEFMKHARTDHRTDLSMWCKQCGKCFSNAGVLVSHIKERACIKEEMIYKCGVKDCVFETTSGQTFVHHLRHCHKGSPFIFCVHCQKIFTLPHCLILHMQDDCPFKEKNRRNPGAVSAQPTANKAAPVPVQPRVTPTVTMSPAAANVVRQPSPATYGSVKPTAPKPGPVPSPMRTSLSMVGISRGRGGAGRGGRGRGRGRGRVRISDSSDSDDPDDPSWRPEETLGETGLRRSGRWAKKINDVMNPEPSTSGVSTPASKKSFTSAEINSNMINCPICDFMAAFQSVLEDHYIANHKVPNKNACLVCHLKFENTRSYLEHFDEHRKGSLPNGPPPDVKDTAPKPAVAQSPATIPAVTIPVSVPKVLTVESVKASDGKEGQDTFDGVLTSIADTKLADPMSCKDIAIKIPYQAAIHDKNLKDSKLKKFEELKSPSDLITMKTIQKLQHYFKCALYTCTFTTDSFDEFHNHLKGRHEGKRYHCCYCFKEELNSNVLAKHIVFKHNKRIYQCSKCFYRASSKAHLQIHIKNVHSLDVFTDILLCDTIALPVDVSYKEDSTEDNSNTTWPYICAIGQCDYSTYDPKEFKKHNEMIHRTVSIYYCYYCKVDFLTFKRLMNHYRLHGLNLFQCNYCIHGAETKEEILLHLCNLHADQPLKAYMRGSQEEASSEVKQLNNVISETANGADFPGMFSVKNDISSQNASKVSEAEKRFTGYEDKLYHIIENTCYPAHMRSMCYPRYLKNLISDLICGIPFCNEKFDSIHVYTSHLRNVHDALNLPCPHCPEMNDNWDEFQNHLLCHGSRLYACGVEECDYYDWNKDKVKEHKKQHGGAEHGAIAIREFEPLEEENKLHALTLTVEFPVSKDTLLCLFCKYKCSDRNIMKNHLYREMGYQRFDCSLCEKKCLSRKEIKDHFTSAHPDMDILCSADYNVEIETLVKSILMQPHKFDDIKLTESCDMCCRKFKNPVRLQSHLYLCLQKEYRPFECDQCKTTLANLLALKFHVDEEHHPNPFKFSVLLNNAIEEDIEKNLLKVRLKQLRDVFEENKLNLNMDEKAFKVKFYTCSECPYEAHHKFNVQRHNKIKHDGSAKVMKGIEKNIDSENLASQLDESSNDNSNFVKRYSCGNCMKKMFTIHEVEMHMRKAHTVKNNEYFYYYTPNVNTQFSADDKEIFECAYCKSTRENLHALKKHADLMHSEMEFKVKGFVSYSQSAKNYLACGYCYLKVKSPVDLHVHSTSSHPLLALKSFGDFQTNRNKHSLDTSDDIPNKRVKFNSTVFVCSHCGGAFSSEEQVAVHSKKAHSRINLEFTKMEQSSSSSETSDFKFFKCEFCKFTSEKQYLDKHLATKHKMRVTCSYCNKRFEFASRLKEHHDIVHKDLPLKYSQETVTMTAPSTVELSTTSCDKNENEESESVSHYKRKPEPVDLSSITVHMETKEGQSADLPLVYVTERFNLFPKVIIKDVLKKD